MGVVKYPTAFLGFQVSFTALESTRLHCRAHWISQLGTVKMQVVFQIALCLLLQRKMKIWNRVYEVATV